MSIYGKHGCKQFEYLIKHLPGQLERDSLALLIDDACALLRGQDAQSDDEILLHERITQTTRRATHVAHRAE